MYRYKTAKVTGSRTCKSLNEFHAVLSSEENKHLLAHSSGKLLVQLIKAGDTTSLLLWDPDFVAQLKNPEFLHMDATFRAIPNIGERLNPATTRRQKHQLLIVMAVIHNHASYWNIYLYYWGFSGLKLSSTSRYNHTSSDLIETILFLALCVCVSLHVCVYVGVHASVCTYVRVWVWASMHGSFQV